jgi:hypothetical protein
MVGRRSNRRCETGGRRPAAGKYARFQWPVSRLPHAALALFVAATPIACDKYEGPPVASLPELRDGLLPDPAAPLVVAFSKPFDEASLRMKVVRFATDVEGNLADEDADESTQLSILYSHDLDAPDKGGRYEAAPDGLSLKIVPSAAFPINSRLALLIEPGLADREGHATTTRKRFVFGYELKLTCNKPSKVVPSGKYFILFDVKKPIGTQIQLWGAMRVNESTGDLVGQFTNADRNMAPNRCPFSCKSTEACRLLPAPACVVPSERAGTVDEFSDYVPNAPPNPTGYSFTVRGCVEDLGDGTASLVTLPTDLVVNQPQVTLRNSKLAGTFTLEGGVSRGSGTVSGDEVLIGSISSGRGEGGFTARYVPDAEAAPGIPEPPP